MKHGLVVDDSRLIRKVARRILEGMDFSADEAADGSEALQSCRAQMPDVILLDWRQPHAPGMEFLRSLRRQAEGGRPVVVVCTTENDPLLIAEALNAGANEYILKPFDREVLAAKLGDVGLL